MKRHNEGQHLDPNSETSYNQNPKIKLLRQETFDEDYEYDALQTLPSEVQTLILLQLMVEPIEFFIVRYYVCKNFMNLCKVNHLFLHKNNIFFRILKI